MNICGYMHADYNVLSVVCLLSSIFYLLRLYTSKVHMIWSLGQEVKFRGLSSMLFTVAITDLSSISLALEVFLKNVGNHNIKISSGGEMDRLNQSICLT